MEVTGNRKQVPNAHVDEAIMKLRNKLYSRLEEKGNGTLASTHEILGIIEEEHDELKEAVRSNRSELVMRELLDIAVACVFGYACIDKGHVDW